MSSLLENIKEVRQEVDGLFTTLDPAMTKEEVKKAAEIERKLAEIDKEIGVFFSGQI